MEKWRVHFRRHRLFLCKCIEKLQLIRCSPDDIPLLSFYFQYIENYWTYICICPVIHSCMYIYLEIYLFTSKQGKASVCILILDICLYSFQQNHIYICLLPIFVNFGVRVGDGEYLLLLPISNLPSLAMILNTNTNIVWQLY